MDEGIDIGDIIDREEIRPEPIDTGKTLYHKLEQCAVELFKKNWPLIRCGQSPRIPQNRNEGTYHRVRDTEGVDEIDLNRTYTGRELVNIIRARTFPPYPGAYFWHNGRKIYLRLELLYEEQLRKEKAVGNIHRD